MTTPQTQAARWYSIDKHGAATLCVDEDDAHATATDSQTLYPHNGPYRAVQLVELIQPAQEPAQAGESPDEREAFEVWAWKRLQLNTERCQPPEDGFYMWQSTMDAWMAWQAATDRAALAARKPLTDEQLWANDEIMSLNADLGWNMETIKMFARAVERAHGIGINGLEVKP